MSVPRPSSIRTLLLLLVLAAGLPVATLGLWFGLQAQASQTRVAEAELVGMSRTVTAGIQQFLKYSERVLQGVASTPAVRELDAEACGDQLATLTRQLNSVVVSVDLWSRDGRLICGTLPGLDPGVTLAGTGSFDESVSRTGFGVSPLFSERRTGRWSTALTYPVEGPGGERGMVAAVVDLVRFQEILLELDPPPGGIVTITDSAGVVLARSRNAGEWVGRQIPSTSSREAQLEAPEGETRAEALEGETFAWRFTDIPGTPWTVYVGVPEEALYGPVWRKTTQIALVGLMVVVLALIAGTLVYRRISRSLQKLVEGVDAGDPVDFTPLPEDGPEEIARVAERFNEAWRHIHRLQQRVSQGEKMEALGRMAGGIAHDFNNLLTIIGGQADLVRSDPHLRPQLREQVEEIELAAEKGGALVRQLMDFCRGTTASGGSVELDAVMEDMRRLLASVAGTGVTVTIEPGGAGSVKADRSQLEQVLMNLVVNARDAMGEEGRILIRTRRAQVSDTEAEDHTWARPGTYFVVSVEDTGPGIPDDVLPHIFEPFFTTKAAGQGTGLGLATVFGVVQSVDGHVRVRTEPGSGACFEVFLPAQEAGALEPAGSAVAD